MNNENKNSEQSKNNGSDVSPNGTNPLQFISNRFGSILKKGEDMIHSVRNSQSSSNQNNEKFQNLYYNGFFFLYFNFC